MMPPAARGTGCGPPPCGPSRPPVAATAVTVFGQCRAFLRPQNCRTITWSSRSMRFYCSVRWPHRCLARRSTRPCSTPQRGSERSASGKTIWRRDNTRPVCKTPRSRPSSRSSRQPLHWDPSVRLLTGIYARCFANTPSLGSTPKPRKAPSLREAPLMVRSEGTMRARARRANQRPSSCRCWRGS